MEYASSLWLKNSICQYLRSSGSSIRDRTGSSRIWNEPKMIRNRDGKDTDYSMSFFYDGK